MAVTFKVPSSPKKDVFEIDNFLGVDLTNTGSNIDEVRSPNAPNMVRYVPGKVRKRTGYKTQVEFSTGTNVNRAKNTSDEWLEVDVSATTSADADLICEFYDTFAEGSTFYVCMEIEAVGSYRALLKSGSYGWNISGTPEAPYHRKCYRFSQSSTYGDVNGLYVYKTSDPTDDDYFRIKNIMVFWKTSATSADELMETEWRPAPEDNGSTFVKTESDSKVNGVHKILIGEKNGNSVIDQNRARGIWSSNEWLGLGTSANIIWTETIPKGQHINIQFEYKDMVLSAGSSYAYFKFGDNEVTIPQLDSGQTSGIVSNTIILEADNSNTFGIYGIDSISIKGVMITYEKSADIIPWSQSPEERGTDFNIGDIYSVEDTNYSQVSAKTFEFESETVTRKTDVYVANGILEPMPGIWEISFDASAEATPSENVGIGYFVGLKLDTDPYSTQYVYINTAHLYGNHDWKKNTAYIYCPNGWSVMYVGYELVYPSATTCSFNCEIKNVKISKASFRSTYNSISSATLYHVGNCMYMKDSFSNEISKISESMNDEISSSWQFDKSLYIIDGKRFRRFNGTTLELEDVEDIAKIPTVTIAKSPNGGGVSYEPFNLLQNGFIETFAGDGESTTYQLSVQNIDFQTPQVWVMNSDGEFIEKTYGTDFSVRWQLGQVVFTAAPDVSPLSGEDNVKIQAYKSINGYADRINKCTIGTLFGVNGASDRLFLSGNSEYRNTDFYSEQYDPTYFPDTGYSSLGVQSSRIVGYSKVNNYLATHKDELETELNVLVREGDLIKRTVNYGDKEFEFSDPAFKLINTIQGAGAIGKHTFGNLQTEPIFLTKSGLYAITAQDLTGEKYGQNRSFYLNGQLLKEENLENAVATVYNDMYILAVNNKLYILDGLQPVRTDKSEPYATRQYVGFYCTDVPANIIFTQDDALWIGTFDGKICRFATDIEDLKSYNDDGKAIYCCWETPDLDGRLFYKNKTFRYFAIRMMKALRTSVTLYSQKLGGWSPPIKEDTSSGVIFDFENIDFELFSFSTDTSEKVVHTKMRVKKVDKARFKVENGKLNEPFGLFDLALEYVESGNYKG